MKKIFLLGSFKAKNLMTALFYLGVFMIIYQSYMLSKIACTYIKLYGMLSGFNTTKVINDFVNPPKISVLQRITDNNVVLFMAIFAVLFIFLTITWKVICELLNKLFCYVELRLDSYNTKAENEQKQIKDGGTEEIR